MFEVKNISTNPLPLSDGKMIAPGDTRKLKEVSKREEEFQSRGWLSIADATEKKEESSVPKQNEGAKKQ